MAVAVLLLSRQHFGADVKDIFLCHTGADKEWVERLAERLETETVGARAISVWFDKWDIEGGENILSKIEAGLKESRYVAVVLSPAITKADWPTLEWQTQVFDDPAGKRGRILPLLRHVFDPITAEPIEIPLPLKILKRYDFSDERRFEEEFATLLRQLRGEPPQRGRNASAVTTPEILPGPEQPDDVPDSLLSNLLPVTHLPMCVHGDESTVTSATAVIDAVRPRIPWLLSGGRLFTFHDPASPKNPFKSILTGRLRKAEKIADWLASDKRSASAVRLLNDALRGHCRALNIWSMTDKRDVFFFAIPNRRPRQFRWGQAGRPRTLAKMVTGSTGEPFGVHHAAQLRFINLGGYAFLLIQPGWTFTSDGASPLPGKQRGMLSMRWGGRERNAAVLRNILMWALVLSKGQPEIVFDLGPETMRVSATPAHSQLNVGVRDDSLQLSKILGGDGAGETEDPGDADELDRVATLRDVPAEPDALEGSFDEDEESV
jgi:hypothetical protein